LATYLAWRLRRVTRYEAQKIAISQEKIEDDYHERARLLGSMAGASVLDATHPNDIRGQAQWTKRAERAFKRFPSEPADKVLKGEVAGDIVFGVYFQAKKRLDGELDWETLDLPGISDEDDIYEPPDMKVEDVRRCIEVFASVASADPDELFASAAYEAGCDARGAAFRKEEMERALVVNQRERILPDAETMQKIARYEAHLSRQLYQALHVLEVLQAK
jgi:hypothetical protein